jgi:hypothetical protein
MNKLKGGLWIKDYNEIYGVFDTYRNNKNDAYIKTVCTNPQLELTCLEAKFLKYILKLNLKLGKEKRIELISNSKLDKKKILDCINKINIKFEESIDELNKLSTESMAGGGKILIALLLPIKIIVAIIPFLIMCALAIPLGVTAGITSGIVSFINEEAGDKVFKIILAPVTGIKKGLDMLNIGKDINELRNKTKQIGGNENNKKQVITSTLNIMNFIKKTTTELYNKIYDIKIDNISIDKICVNKDNNNKHVKCEKKDYNSNDSNVNIEHVKIIFNNVDKVIEKIKEEELQNIKDTNSLIKIVNNETLKLSDEELLGETDA